MRVIAGQFKGRQLSTPKGSNTRPTTDRVRESLFSTLASARGGFDDAVVLDAFAGSGALGIETLSRGAAFALFCEKDRHALAALKSNLSFVPADSYALVAGDVLKRNVRSPQAFDLLFFDPPYALEPATVARIIYQLENDELLAPQALISYEFSASLGEAPLLREMGPEALEYVTHKSYGTTTIDIYRKV
ncbi:MAG: 16S rRNA (guanine(966)-N(2))-methyltransferase RsmD [Eggerthellaceae bacterium]|nr:16S rRNA (guanine(966)-N(2))-methyltransferase RsmD [Eggerthellaceae bacterium]